MSTGFVVALVPGRDAGFQRRQIDERLERRAGLAARLDGAVEHRALIIDAAQQRRDRAVRLHHHHRGFMDACRACRICRSRWAAASARGFLQLRLQRGVDDQVGVGRDAVLRRQLLGLVGGGVEEIIARIQCWRGRSPWRDGRGRRRPALR